MEKNVAYSLLNIKALDDNKRIIRGIATSPEPDRVGDVVEPMGCEFKNPSPLLWMHNHDLPVGTVKFGKPTKEGVPFEAELPVVTEPSGLKARIDEAWQSVKAGLIRAVSIGFRPLEYSIIEETGGYRFTRSEIYELSLVTVPANANATINYVKSLDKAAREAATGKIHDALSVSKKPSVKGTVKLTSKEKEMSFSEKLKGFRDELALKNSKLVELAQKSVDTGETFNAADQEEFDNLNAEIKSLETHIERLEVAEKAAASTARPVVADVAGQTDTGAAQTRSKVFAQVKAAPKMDKGIGFARLARCKALSKLDNAPAYEIARSLYGEDSPVYGVLKAAVAAGTTTQATWAAPLVGDESTIFADFVEFLRPMTILGRMGQNGIPGPRVIPFRTRLISQTSGGSGYWTGEGNPKPLTKFDFTGTTLEPLKVANIAVVTMELLRDSSPSAEAIVRDSLASALAERLDIDFVDPTKTASAGVSPASITNGVSAIASTGTDADAVRCDIANLLNAYANANNPPTSGVILMSTTKAIALMTMRNALGAREFPEITMNGGFLEGFPVITSQYIADFAVSAGEFVFMVNASDIWLGDEGGITVDMSDQASLQFLDNPTNSPVGSTTATSLISLWQNNCVGFRAERTINWAKRRASAVAVLDEVNWTSCP
jgi:HK97 family phage major capsid protein/HK97 family phage prohead protease